MTEPTPAADRQGPSYEELRAELERVVRELESGRVPLEEAMALWEKGEKLADACQKVLDGYRTTVEKARAAHHRDVVALGDEG